MTKSNADSMTNEAVAKGNADRPIRVVIMGAAGHDFHNFNVVYRDNPAYRVVAFTATQIPNIEGRMYPPELAGELYPEGIPIVPKKSWLTSCSGKQGG